MIKLRSLGTLRQILIAGFQFIHQPFFNRRHPQPYLARGNFIDGQLWAVLRDEVLEQLMRDVQVLLKLLTPLFSVFAKHGQRALVLASGQYFVINVMLFQQSIDVRQLRDHTDRTEDGERRADDFGPNASHHVATTGGHFIDTHRQRNARLTNPRQLRRGQTIAVYHAAAAFQPQYHFIGRGGQGQQGGDLVTQAFSGRGLDIAIEIEDKHARLLIRLFLQLLFSLAAVFAQGLQLILGQQ